MADLESSLALLGQLSSKDRKLCFETLIKIYRNVTSNSDEAKFRTLKLENKRFEKEVWRHEGAQLVMLSSGWVLLDDVIHLPEDTDVSDTLNLLVECRNVKPEESEWVSSTKVIGQQTTKLREEQLRKRAMEEKQKEMASLKKDMAERKAIAERILREHKDDMKNKKVNKPSIAVPRGEGKGAKMTDMVPKQQGG